MQVLEHVKEVVWFILAGLMQRIEADSVNRYLCRNCGLFYSVFVYCCKQCENNLFCSSLTALLG